MSTSYSGPATLHINGTVIDVHAKLTTDVSEGVYSWGGRLTTSDPAAVRVAGWGGILTLPVPASSDRPVHVVAVELGDSGCLLRVHGAGRAPYEQDGEISAVKLPDGSTFYEWTGQL